MILKKSAMHISGAIIKNFRCFRYVELSFETLTTLIGENGTGKTAVLEALNYAFSPSFLSSRINEQDFHNSTDECIEINVMLSESFTVNISDGYSTKEVSCDQIFLSIKRREKASPRKALSDPFTITHYVVPDSTVCKTEKGWSLMRQTSSSPFNFTSRQLSFPISSDDFPKTFYFNKQRLTQADPGFNTTLDRITTEYNWRVTKNLEKIKDGYEKNWQTIYSSLIDSIGKDKYQDTFLAFKEKLGIILCQNMDNLELSPLNLRQPFSKSFLSMREGLNQIHFHGLGSGVSILISLLFLETISSLSGEEVIFLIDEPEMHLHPQLQDRLYDYLDSINKQVIYTTHSNHLVRLRNWKSILRLDIDNEAHPKLEALESCVTYKGKDNTVAEHLDEVKKYYQDKTIYTKENNDIFFANGCVLVEGPADKYAIEVMSANDYSSTTIITCNGKDKIFYYQLLCKAFGIPFFTLFDLDGHKPDDEPNATIIQNSFNDCYFHFNKSLEDCFGIPSEKHKTSKVMRAIDDCKDIHEEISVALKRIAAFIETTKRD
jgi:predicted ATP-dependent endonuclease of OLD family